jgi:hypothetical protein
VLAALARRAGRSKVRLVNFPEGDPLIRRLKRGSVSAETYYHRSGGAMIRTINLASCLGKMAGELSTRLAGSCMDRWRGKLLIADARDKVALDVDRGRVTVGKPAATKHAVRGGEEIAQLLIGTDEPGEIIDAAGMRLTGDARGLVGVLFPNRQPALRPWDRY